MIRSLTRMALMAAIAIPGLGLSAPSAKAQTESVTFTLVNGTSEVMTHFYASPPSTSSWESDILGQDVLNPNEYVNITVDDGREDCTYDFRAIFADGTESVSRGSVCNGDSYTYTD
ncbi:MAG: hypothetical protein EA001_01080 [Oscillatoriales cyanobacterium]|nr:MAG: hypothetical protein EA001_01080 [Oscillatoriales cyanobacterium]